MVCVSIITELQHATGNMYCSYEHDLLRNVDWSWRAHCLASLVAGAKCDWFFSCEGNWRGECLRTPSALHLPRRDLVTRL